MWRVFRFALTPLVNTFFTVCCIVLLGMTLVEKIIQKYKANKMDKEFDEWIRKYCNEEIEKETYL